jgi:hypothetical protein
MMGDEDLELSGLSSSATGILECLRMLADEAAELQLGDTLRALREAIAVCQTEGSRGDACDLPGMSVPPDVAIH